MHQNLEFGQLSVCAHDWRPRQLGAIAALAGYRSAGESDRVGSCGARVARGDGRVRHAARRPHQHRLVHQGGRRLGGRQRIARQHHQGVESRR